MSLRPFADPSENLPADKLQGLCERGILDRYGSSGRLKQAKQRLEHELEVIAKFPDGAEYFLLLNQVIEFARGKGISATVRGSACGSIVCYILKLRTSAHSNTVCCSNDFSIRPAKQCPISTSTSAWTVARRSSLFCETSSKQCWLLSRAEP